MPKVAKTGLDMEIERSNREILLARKSLANQQQKINDKKREIIDGLPHLYGWPWYSWARTFFESQNKIALLCAANQISKSSTQIRKAIHWATAPKLWPSLWPTKQPRQFWYCYPSKDVWTSEFHEKWVPEFLPRGAYKTHPVYGWKESYDSRHKIDTIRFNSGVTIYCKVYTQDTANVQTGTLDAIFCDEELPEEFLAEFMARLFRSDGYFSMVFTATLGQDTWLRAIEGSGDNELYPNAHKQQISMWDCQFYEDGSPTVWTPDRIRQVEASCQSQAEVLRRVHGRFVVEKGRKYGTFLADRHYCKPFPIPSEWAVYAGVDIGSGGKENHPAAIAFIAVRPDHKVGYVFKGWRGDGIETTSGDVLEKFRELRGPKPCVLQSYDGAAKDFGTISTRINECFVKAEKSHEFGEDVINTLFKNDMLFIFDTDELRKLGSELTSLMKSTAKNKAKDDFCDAMRYGLMPIPWDWTSIQGERLVDRPEEISVKPLTEAERYAEEIRQRRGDTRKPAADANWADVEDEVAYWNEQY